MTNNSSISLPLPAFAGGTKAITLTPVVGTPRREYAEMFIPGEEELEDGELRVTVLGSGNPWNTRAQASASVQVSEEHLVKLIDRQFQTGVICQRAAPDWWAEALIPLDDV
ncbi:MAG: hypothetical protein MUC85_11845 [Anaerolineales bacterium]|nr:hypothetical protein [Anaerolineales bacterium]